jgi:hypothetical protein
MIKTVVALATAAMLATSAQAITVINGSFEDGVAVNGTLAVASGDTTSITGWRVLPTGTDIVDNTVWEARSGSRSIELSGADRGGVSQLLGPQFTPGERYRISFWLSVNPFAADGDYRALVSASGGGAQSFTYTKTAANSATNMLWQRYFYLWTPAAANSAISFRTIDAGARGIVLDNVSVGLVPEPTTWAMLLAGFGMTGFALRRRRNRVVAA